MHPGDSISYSLRDSIATKSEGRHAFTSQLRKKLIATKVVDGQIKRREMAEQWMIFNRNQQDNKNTKTMKNIGDQVLFLE